MRRSAKERSSAGVEEVADRPGVTPPTWLAQKARPELGSHIEAELDHEPHLA